MNSKVARVTSTIAKFTFGSQHVSKAFSRALCNQVVFKSLNAKPTFSFCSDEPKNPVEVTEENAHQIINTWVTKNQVVLFMKGTPANPQCGYSNFVVELLKKYGNSRF